jgi:hypothetical protein
MTSIRIETLLAADMLFLPELKPLVGKAVEIVVTELPARSKLGCLKDWTSPLAGTVLAYEASYDPAASLEEWEATR